MTGRLDEHGIFATIRFFVGPYAFILMRFADIDPPTCKLRQLNECTLIHGPACKLSCYAIT